jgi:hypothetical protein
MPCHTYCCRTVATLRVSKKKGRARPGASKKVLEKPWGLCYIDIEDSEYIGGEICEERKLPYWPICQLTESESDGAIADRPRR